MFFLSILGIWSLKDDCYELTTDERGVAQLDKAGAKTRAISFLFESYKVHFS